MASLKQRVPFHVTRFLVAGAVFALILVGVFLREENTRTTLGGLKGNIANRCVQGDDGACRKLLDRLLNVSKLSQRQRIRDIIQEIPKGVVGNGGKGNPHGQPGGAPSPPSPGEGNGGGQGGGQGGGGQGGGSGQGLKDVIQGVDDAVNGAVDGLQEGLGQTVDGLQCMLDPQRC